MYCTDAQMDLNYRKILKSVDENMMARDLNSLKFLCQDYIPAGKLENVRKPRDIFQELEYKGYLGPGEKLYFLADILQKIHRVDLIKKLGLGKPRDVHLKIERDGRPGPQFTPFRLLLLSVCDNLTNDDLETLKFYCHPFISKGTMDEMKDAPSMLSFLEQSARIGEDDVDFLADMIDSLENEQLLGKVNAYKANIGSSSSSDHEETKLYQPIQPQHRMVPSGRGFNDTPRYAAIPQAEIPLMPPSYFMSGNYRMPKTPYNHQMCQQPVSYPPVEQSGRYIGVMPAVPDARAATPHPQTPVPAQVGVEEGEASNQTPTCVSSHQQPEENMAAPANQEENEVAVTERQSQQPQENVTVSQPGSLVEESERVPSQPQEFAENVAVVANRIPGKLNIVQGHPQSARPVENVQVTESSQENQELSTRLQRLHFEQEKIEMPSYKMNTSPLGLCIIISNEHFYVDERFESSRPLEDRKGTKVDRDNLFFLFRRLDFVLEVKNDLTAEEMRDWLDAIGRQDHSGFSCFVCCILSHGSAGTVYGADGVPVDVGDLTRSVKGSRCPTLVGKPKLYFMQACQGRRQQTGVQLEIDSSDDQPADSIPNEADFLFGYATVPGFVSYRSKTQGSWYITKLVECIDKYHEQYDLLSIMVKVNEEVAKAIAKTQQGERKQVPAPLVTLRRKVFLQPIQKPVV